MSFVIKHVWQPYGRTERHVILKRSSFRSKSIVSEQILVKAPESIPRAREPSDA